MPDINEIISRYESAGSSVQANCEFIQHAYDDMGVLIDLIVKIGKEGKH